MVAQDWGSRFSAPTSLDSTEPCVPPGFGGKNSLNPSGDFPESQWSKEAICLF